jgi:hypothetical protein
MLYAKRIASLRAELLLAKEEVVTMLRRTNDAVERALLRSIVAPLWEAAARCDPERCSICGLGTPEPCRYDGCDIAACGNCLQEAHVAVYGDVAERRCPKAPEPVAVQYDGPPESDIEW